MDEPAGRVVLGVAITPRRVVVIALGIWWAGALVGLAIGPPLGHDEAAYARVALRGPETEVYRPLGTVALARVGLALGGSDLALRAPSAILGGLLILAVARLGRGFGPWTGAWAASVIAGTHSFTMRSFQLLNDVPATAGLLIAAAIMIDELDRDDGPTPRLIGIAPVLAATLYLRYGSVLAIALMAVAAVAVWPRACARRPGVIAATALAFALLITPFLAYSLAVTGSPTGVLEISRQVATFPIGQGLARFFLSSPVTFYGPLAPLVALAGLVGGGALGRAHRHRRRTHFLLIVSVAMTLWLGLTSDGSARFLFLPIAALVILGIAAIERVLAARPRARRPALPAARGIVVLGWVGTLVATWPIQRHIAALYEGMMTASAAIRIDAAGRPCVVAAYWTSQLMWYSGCAGFRARGWEQIERHGAEPRWYVASMPGHPVQLDRIAGGAARALPLPGGTAWYLVPRNGVPQSLSTTATSSTRTRDKP